MNSKTRYVIVEGEWKIVYSTPNYESAKKVMQSYVTEFPGLAGKKYFTLYEMTKLEVDNVTEEEVR